MADVYTPVGIYLRLRDRFRDTILLESADFHGGENSYSFIAINAIAGIEIKNQKEIEYKFPLQEPKKSTINSSTKITDEIWNFMNNFNITTSAEMPVSMAQGMFGYISYDAVQFFEDLSFSPLQKEMQEHLYS